MLRRLFLLLAVILMSLVSATSASPYAQNTTIDATASWLAMRPVSVRCLTQQESDEDPAIAMGAAAYVLGDDYPDGWHPWDYSVFMHGVCEPLVALAAGDLSGYSVGDVAWSILVLTHESGHLRGVRWSASEARTECWAIRHVRYVARRFGVTDPFFLKMIVGVSLAYHNSMDKSYRLASCKLPTP